jgi:hypothetical protein
MKDETQGEAASPSDGRYQTGMRYPLWRSHGNYRNEDVFNVLRGVASGVKCGRRAKPAQNHFLQCKFTEKPCEPHSGVATQDTTGTNGSRIKTGALGRSLGDTLLAVYRWKQ